MAQINLAIRLRALLTGPSTAGGSSSASSGGTVLNAPVLRAAFARAARLGARAIQIDARNDIRPSELSATGVRQLRKMLDDCDLRVASISFQTRRGYDSPNDLSRRIDATKEAMEMAYKLGAGLVINQIGTVPETTNPAFESLAAVMADLGRFGAHVGAFLAAETGTESGERLASVLGTDDSAYVAVALNPGKLIVNRFSVSDAIKTLGSRILTLVAQDGVVDLAAGRGIHVPVGQGTADFPSILAMLEDFQFAGHVLVGDDVDEADAGARATAAAEYLRNL